MPGRAEGVPHGTPPTNKHQSPKTQKRRPKPPFPISNLKSPLRRFADAGVLRPEQQPIRAAGDLHRRAVRHLPAEDLLR